MNCSPETLWGIYVIVIIISLIVFWNIKYYNETHHGMAFFLAFLIGAITVFIGTAWLNPHQLSGIDKTWLGILFLIAFSIPIVMLLYILWCQPMTN